MEKIASLLVGTLISLLLVTGCASSKTRVFGDEMPTMKEVHDTKFNRGSNKPIEKMQRSTNAREPEPHEDFVWLPNPTLHMYVFKHLTAAGHPVPGYTTFFKLYETDLIAEPGESGGWE